MFEGYIIGSIMSSQTMTLDGGCFWCLETAYNTLEGVTSAYSGYSYGQTHNPSYEDVCSGNTGHNEVVQVTFDTSKLSLREVLDIFFTLHNPTQLNRQGNDREHSIAAVFITIATSKSPPLEK
ncbi:MAG: peptide-methionine (S)-S-oxide reductase [Glaciecola sp.]|jgi:peptide-methionine (S)-S-oxide reductase